MYKVIVDYDPRQVDKDTVSDGVFAAHAHLIGEKDKTFSVFLKNDVGQVLAGAQVSFDAESVYIDSLWVDDALRDKGYGKQLLNAVEQEAIKQGCHLSTTNTWDFQAEGFYLKNGYAYIGEIKNYWKGHSMIFLRKNLIKV
jgi:GNAT superfamily N-acetyltransferase